MKQICTAARHMKPTLSTLSSIQHNASTSTSDGPRRVSRVYLVDLPRGAYLQLVVGYTKYQTSTGIR